MLDDDLYDRQGHPLTLIEWSRLMRDMSYKILKQEMIGDLFVSTVWLGMDHSFGDGPPLIFETMVFDRSGEADSREDVLCHRYATEVQAFAGHAMVVNDLTRSLKEIEEMTE